MSCSRTQHGGGRSRTPDLSLRSPTLYHWATAFPNKGMSGIIDPHILVWRARHTKMCGSVIPFIPSLNDQNQLSILKHKNNWAAPSEFGIYRLCEQRRFRRACASAQSRQNLRCSLIKAVSQEEPSDGKLDPWPRWMAGHAQLKFVMTECSKTQIRLSRPNYVKKV